MPPVAEATHKTGLVIDRGSHTIRLTRDLDASCAEIFEAWTKPEQVTAWWDASGGTLSACEIDLRLGGAFRFVAKSHPDMPFAGIYREIAPPSRLVFEAMGATGRVLLKDVAGKTQMIVEIECRSAEQLDEYLRMGIDAGTAQTLDNLVAYARRQAIAVP
jgi:uncharacterized protein YndB with AHSA1/START domain